MWRKLSIVSILLLGSLSVNAQEVDTTTPATVTTVTTAAAPAPQQVIVSPVPQSGNCKTIPAHWKDTTWIAEQTICQYTNRTEGTAWVNDYWSCTAYDAGNCKTWVYQPGYWVQTTP